MLFQTIALIFCCQAARDIKNPFDFQGIEKAARQFLDGLQPADWLTPAPGAQNVKSRRDVGNVTPPYVSYSAFQENVTTAPFESVGAHYLDVLRKRAIATATPETFYISTQVNIQDSGRMRTINWSQASALLEAVQRKSQPAAPDGLPAGQSDHRGRGFWRPHKHEHERHDTLSRCQFEAASG